MFAVFSRSTIDVSSNEQKFLGRGQPYWWLARAAKHFSFARACTSKSTLGLNVLQVG